MKSRNLYENRKDCVTNRAKSDTVIIKSFFGHLDIWGDKLSAQTQGWTFGVIERQQIKREDGPWAEPPAALDL